jgi:hypothetical protein
MLIMVKARVDERDVGSIDTTEFVRPYSRFRMKSRYTIGIGVGALRHPVIPLLNVCLSRRELLSEKHDLRALFHKRTLGSACPPSRSFGPRVPHDATLTISVH